MSFLTVFLSGVSLVPAALMLLVALLPRARGVAVGGLWRAFVALSAVALLAAALSLCVGSAVLHLPVGLQASPLTLVLTLLVQLLSTVIASFSARYLQGEDGQRRFVAALAAVVASVHLLLLADHWVVLILAWALVGAALQRLLCFYPDRVFARLAAHKKRIADRVADVLLIAAAALAWSAVGSGSLSDLWAHIARDGMSTSLQLSAVGLVLAVILRTALFPVHGWLIQVMEAPTPVSALLHAGVVNLGGFVLIRFAPLLDQAMLARVVLSTFGLVTAVLAGMVMLTRISIKVRLAWSTVAQMGFMLLECGLGLYTLAALHLVGHSLYKAHSFLSASSIVRQTRLEVMHGPRVPAAFSVVLAPVVTLVTIELVEQVAAFAPWPWWWSAVLALAWAPLMWVPAQRHGLRNVGLQGASGVLMVAGLTALALLVHALPLGTRDVPEHTLGVLALMGMSWLYLCLGALQLRPQMLRSWRQWSYAAFYVDEAYTRLALQIWPGRWAPQTCNSPGAEVRRTVAADPAR